MKIIVNKNAAMQRKKQVIDEILLKAKEAADKGLNSFTYYFKEGDRVRHHAGLNTYEKEDKTNDTFIFCNACLTRNDIQEQVCHKCKCPLLK